jgi:hypothetical protein
VVVSLTPDQARVLSAIGEHLSATDPHLARRLSEPGDAPVSTARELLVMAVLLGWVVLGCAPLALGLALATPGLFWIGVATAWVGGPLGMWATLRWVRRHRFVRFRDASPP